MIDDMGIFRTTVGVASLNDPQRRVDVEHMMVDTGSEYTCCLERGDLRPLDCSFAARSSRP